MKNVKPMLGAMTICGKDSLGRKLILPTDHKSVKKPSRFAPNKKKPSWIKRIINVFSSRKKTYNKLGVVTHVAVVKFSKKGCDAIRDEYMAGVSERIEKIQSAIKAEKRALFLKAMGL